MVLTVSPVSMARIVPSNPFSRMWAMPNASWLWTMISVSMLSSSIASAKISAWLASSTSLPWGIVLVNDWTTSTPRSASAGRTTSSVTLWCSDESS